MLDITRLWAILLRMEMILGIASSLFGVEIYFYLSKHIKAHPHHPVLMGTYHILLIRTHAPYHSVKNEPIKRISKVIQMLNDSSGRKMNRIDGPVQTQTPSVQGIWTPFLDVSDKKFGMEIVQDGAK